MTDLAARCVEEFGEAEGAQIIRIASALMAAPAQPAKTGEARPPFSGRPAPSPFRRRVIPVARSEARAAAGTTSDLVNAKIVREAALSIADPAAPETEAVAEAVALLKEIAPRDAREALIARRLVAMDALAVETIALARASTGLLRDAYAGQAVALSRAATELDEALERRRGGKPEQRIVVQHIRGGQAIGMVNK